ncbi:polyribonucleotide nucleotidyltransferase [Spiroplasma endosymbiont of Lariophagus distinguendus]|uniref:polyribonucleotide nucleotidyltransferase n=1 Tax=Spiroplasma endosymbiont of Lariophagus distinguendus TaxID=2935082 RepID=UPI00207A3C56|nr:polyribonucleotide nucleotidyltransferase [Spiroplasma endosymbiont of Lariophagus distinguendus]
MLKEKFLFKEGKYELIVELGTMANLAEKSVKITYGNTVVLTTVSYNEVINNQDFFPLQIVFQEKLYSVGKIPGGFLKREGRPSEYATLCARLIDRSIRPLFPKGFVNEVQVVNNVFALDDACDVRVNAAFGTSLALGLSSLPFQGPSATVVVGKINDELVLNPTQEQLLNSKMELIVGGTKDAINMVEAGCHDILEKDMIKALKFAHEHIIKLIIFQESIIEKLKPNKFKPQLALIPVNIEQFVETNCQSQISKISTTVDKKSRSNLIKNLVEETFQSFKNKFNQEVLNAGEETTIHNLRKSIDQLLQKAMRTMILKNNVRVDGRKADDIRKLTSMIDVLPIVHGSAMFTRGETQVLSVLTLGALAEHQIIDGLGKEEYKRFIHHYNFPPFSVGETGRMGVPSRREIGHGALGEKALLQIIPLEKDFPYTIRLVSEVLASNGSTSQAAICASSMALMAGGVPIRAAIAGIAMGLIKEEKDFTILTDIQGLEDHLGDMDFKVAGTANGICALQMDIKITGIDFNIITQALEKARIARLQVLANMNEVIKKPRTTLAPNAPKIIQKLIPIDKIRDIIGVGGKVINKIITDCDNVKIDIEDDGRLMIYHNEQSAIDKAWQIIESIVNPVQIKIGSEFDSKVVKIVNFGVFVNLQDKIDGLIHISEFSKKFNKRIDNLNNVVKINDIIKVRVIKVEDNSKLSLEIIDK